MPEKPQSLDIQSNRQSSKYTKLEMFRRVLWMLAGPLFRWSPRSFFGWRRFLLQLFGARIGHNVHIYNSAIIYFPWNLEIGEWSSIGEWVLVYNLGPITIGKHATISLHAHLCAGTHDYTKPDMPLLKPPIVIGDQTWICAGAFIGPGVSIGEGAVVAARSVVTKDVTPWTIVGGNPAKQIKRREFVGPQT